MGEETWTDRPVEGVVLRRTGRRQLIDELSDRTRLPRGTLLEVFASLRDILYEEMKKGGDFSLPLPHLGSIHGHKSKGREVNMPMKQATVFSPPQHKFRFSPSVEVRQQSKVECDEQFSDNEESEDGGQA